MRWIRIGIVGAFALAAVAAAVAGGLAGRDGSGPESDEAVSMQPSAPPDLSATAEIRRSFMEPGQVAIAVTNHGEAEVRVLGVELITESFEPLGVQEFDATVPPSVNPRDLQTRYGEAKCADGVESASEPASVVLSVETEDGAAHEVQAELPYPNGTLDRLLREACAAQAVSASTRIELGELSETEDGRLEGTLSVTPLGDAVLGVTEMRGSVLFEIAMGEPVSGGTDEIDGDDAANGGTDGEGGAGDDVADGDEAGGAADGEGTALTVPMVFDAHRCSGHAVGDAKQPFGFTVWITIDGDEPIATPIEVPDDRRADLWAMLEARCAEAD
jgi:hypothetical protein